MTNATINLSHYYLRGLFLKTRTRLVLIPRKLYLYLFREYVERIPEININRMAYLLRGIGIFFINMLFSPLNKIFMNIKFPQPLEIFS